VRTLSAHSALRIDSIRSDSSVSEAISQPMDSLRPQVRNLGKPVELAQRYYDEGADEVLTLYCG
jgi:imidazole glycerol phosphate synthase subunit HisF